MTTTGRPHEPARFWDDHHTRHAPTPEPRVNAQLAELATGLPPGEALKGETYADLAYGFRIGTSTVYRYIRKALALLAAMAPTLEQAIEVAQRKAFVILDGTLLRIDRVGMASGRDRAFYSGKHKDHGLNVQVIADPIGRLVWLRRCPARATTSVPLVSTGSSTRSPRRRFPRRRHRLPGRRPEGRRSAAAASSRPGHRPLPATVSQSEAGRRGACQPARPG
jgi:hypothetical protein